MVHAMQATGQAGQVGSDNLQKGLLLARLEAIPISRFHIKARLIMGIATFFDAFDVLALAFVLPVLVGLWKMTPPQIGLLIASSFIGQFFGSLFFGAIAERIGRLPAAKYSILLLSLTSLMCAFSWSFTSLLVCRFVQGIGLGGEVPVAATYINELTRAHGRGRFFLLYELIFAVGLTCAAIMGAVMVPKFGWQSMFYIGAVPALLALCMFHLLKESPRWLIHKNRLADAEQVIAGIENGLTDAQRKTAARNLKPVPAIAPLQPRTDWRELFSGFYRTRTLIVWVLWACTFLSVYSLNTWLPSIYKTIFGFSVSDALWAGVLTNVAGLVGGLACALLVDRIGRKTWFLVAFIGAALPLLILGFLQKPPAGLVMTLASISFGFLTANSILLYLYTTEIYPTRMRALGTGLASALLRIASALGPLAVGVALGLDGLSAVFLLFGGIALCGALAACKATETREKILEEIAP
jgi:putative MFS transporter